MLSPLFQVFNCSCVAGFFLILDELAASSVFTLGPYDLPADQKLLSICTSNHLEQLWTKCSFKLLSNCYHLVHWSCRMHLLCCCAWHDYRQSWLGYEQRFLSSLAKITIIFRKNLLCSLAWSNEVGQGPLQEISFTRMQGWKHAQMHMMFSCMNVLQSPDNFVRANKETDSCWCMRTADYVPCNVVLGDYATCFRMYFGNLFFSGMQHNVHVLVRWVVDLRQRKLKDAKLKNLSFTVAIHK